MTKVNITDDAALEVTMDKLEELSDDVVDKNGEVYASLQLILKHCGEEYLMNKEYRNAYQADVSHAIALINQLQRSINRLREYKFLSDREKREISWLAIDASHQLDKIRVKLSIIED